MLGLFIAFALAMVIGLPIALVIAVVGIMGVWLAGVPLNLVIQRMFTGVDLFTLMAVPFFILAGEFMSQSGLTKGLIQLADFLVGRIRGGLAHVNVVAGMFLAGISGSALADTVAVGSVLIPSMKESGYDEDFSVSLTAAVGTIGPIIPPSNVMVIYAVSSGVSVGALFLSGVVPGILLGLSLMVVSYVTAVRRNYPLRSQRFSLGGFVTAFKQSALALVMPLIILGGILGGVFTATEAGAVAAFYSFLVGAFVIRTLTPRKIWDCFADTATTTSTLLLIMATANIASWVLASMQVPRLMVQFLGSVSTDPRIMLAILNAFLLIVGMFMEAFAAIYLLVPIIAPFMVSLGVNPLHLAMVITLNLTIGMITPPVGTNLFAACGLTEGRVGLERASRAILPFVIAEVAVLLIVTYVPPIALTVPSLFGLK